MPLVANTGIPALSTSRLRSHPYLSGNFAPVLEEFVDYECKIVAGSVPDELYGGQYVRNGGNVVNLPEEGRDYHWFDGDGMLHGVFFPPRTAENPSPAPRYTNRHIATPVLSLSLMLFRAPLPSISLLISPLSSLHRILVAIMTTFLLALEAGVGTLSVANTNVIWWGKGLGSEAEQDYEHGMDKQDKRSVDEWQTGRLLATCESGPPMEVRVPALETMGWDRLEDDKGETLTVRRAWWDPRRWSLARLQEDWMTAHPRVDPVNGDLVFYQSSMFEKPYLRYSVIDRNGMHKVWKVGIDIGKAKMMHDFAGSRKHTIFMNLPLTLSPMNMLQWPPRPMIHFDRTLPSEFILIPRNAHHRTVPTRFIEPEPSMIFHTANAWDDVDEVTGEEAVDMVACRFKSAKLVYAAGAVAVPSEEVRAGFNDVVRLQYYRFVFGEDGSHRIGWNFPLSDIPFEFPATHPDLGMQKARFVYGCTMREGGFDERLGGAAKVDVLVKVDVLALSEKGRKRDENMKEAVDKRSVLELLEDHKQGRAGELQVFALPEGWFAQESRFVPRKGTGLEEDDGWLLTYVYNEAYLKEDGSAREGVDTGSELWIIDARQMWKGMESVQSRIKLPQRVPYGLHGTWIPPHHLARQRVLSHPLEPQPSLLDKIYQSRLRHFVNIFLDRPAYREKSKPEKMAFGILFPLAWVMLIMAAVEVTRDYSEKFGTPPWAAWVGSQFYRGLRLEVFPWAPLISGLGGGAVLMFASHLAASNLA